MSSVQRGSLHPSDVSPKGASRPSARSLPFVKTMGPFRTLSRYLGDRFHRVAQGWLIVIVGAAIVADFLPLDPYQSNYDVLNLRPFQRIEYPLGTDALGRDVLARLVFGARTTFTLSLLAVVIGMSIGSFLGVCAAYFRGWCDRVVSFVCDTYLAFPSLVAIMTATVIFGNSLRVLIIILGINAIPAFIRLSRTASAQYVNADFVLATRSYGSSSSRIIFRHIYPNLVRALLSYGAIYAGVLVVTEGALGYFGLGVPAPTPSWGSMIAQGRLRLLEEPHIWAVPGVALVVTILAINFVADRHTRSLIAGSDLYAM